MAVTLETPLPRVLGPKTANGMAEQLNLHTVRDLLRHYPRRYARRGEQADLADVQVGDRVTVLAQVRSVTTRPMRNRRGSLTEVVVGDGSGRMKLVFFNHRHAQLKVDAWGMFAGTVGEWRGEKQFAHPDMHLLDAADDDTDWARALIPNYPASKDVSSWVVQKSVKLLVGAGGGFGELVVDPVPEDIRTRHGLLSLAAAFLDIHRPTTMDDAGGQAALLAPTEVLAAQHVRGIRELLGPLGRAGELDGDPAGTRVTLLTGSLRTAARRAALAEVADGSAGIVIGTHALLQETVEFADLGLVVIDEQHRFGVEQRDALRAKGSRPPHVLVMTATPIPRTVAMTVYGDLEISTLRQLPSGRGGVSSSVVPVTEKRAWLDRAWERLREEVAAGRQAYVVCPRIGEDAGAEEEPDDEDGAPPDETERRPPLAVLDVAELLRSGPLVGLRLEVLHGRLGPDEKEARMRAFAAGEIDVLVATTVVEVGVDVPNATVMVVMDADRFGVSQLHQLRG